MLTKFTVANYRGFREETTLDFSTKHRYDFSSGLVKDGIVNKMLIFGKNAYGKTNIGLALADIVSTLTDNLCTRLLRGVYKNLESKDNVVRFEYVFSFPGKTVVYSYSKFSLNMILAEKVVVDGKVILDIEHQPNEPKINVFDAVTLPSINLAGGDIRGFDLSVVKYINRSLSLSADSPYKQIYDFANGFLLFRSLDDGFDFIGFQPRGSSISDIILGKKKLADFEAFLRDNGVDLHLKEVSFDGKSAINVVFPGGEADLFSIISSGTGSMVLFYSWLISIDESVQFVFVDEFDAFYHHKLAVSIYKILADMPGFQTIFTTHDTYLLQNSLTRPDCAFAISDDRKFIALADRTDKDIRSAHNVEKMYREGVFDGD